MESRGTFGGYDAIQGVISFKVGKVPPDELQSLYEADTLDITAKKHREKRSLDSNAYAWILLSKIADCDRTSKEEVYERMLREYGYIDENVPPIALKRGVDASNLPGHWLRYKESEDGKMIAYLCIKGSSEYDTKQMSRFIEMIVGEAAERGIETLPPDEIARMNERWGK